jgi:hypothetical protein
MGKGASNFATPATATILVVSLNPNLSDSAHISVTDPSETVFAYFVTIMNLVGFDSSSGTRD